MARDLQAVRLARIEAAVAHNPRLPDFADLDALTGSTVIQAGALVLLGVETCRRPRWSPRIAVWDLCGAMSSDSVLFVWSSRPLSAYVWFCVV